MLLNSNRKICGNCSTLHLDDRMVLSHSLLVRVLCLKPHALEHSDDTNLPLVRGNPEPANTLPDRRLYFEIIDDIDCGFWIAACFDSSSCKGTVRRNKVQGSSFSRLIRRGCLKRFEIRDVFFPVDGPTSSILSFESLSSWIQVTRPFGLTQ